MSQAVRAALEGRLDAWATSQSPPIRVAHDNESFQKPADGSLYLECRLIPNSTMNKYTSGTHSTEYGLFQVNIWSINGQGMGEAEGVADAIKALFPIIPKFGPVSVEQTPTVNAPIQDEAGWIISPVLIKYRYEVYG